jgi:multidrug resistance protein, MATE family
LVHFNRIIQELKIQNGLAIPIIIGQLGVMLMGLADTIQVGHIDVLAKESIGAAGIGNGIFITIAIIGIIALQIVAPLIANAHKKNDESLINNLHISSLKVAIILAGVCFFATEILAFNLSILNQKPEIEALAVPYLHVIAISIFPQLIFTALKQLTDGVGRTKIAMNITLIALVLNILLNYLLIYGIGIFPKLGLLGAGIATLIARIFMALSLYFYLMRESYFKNIFTTSINTAIKAENVKKIFKIGLPSGFQGFFEIAIFSAAAILIGQLGSVQLAAHQVAINPASITYMMVTGVAAAGGIRVGAHLGDRQAMKLSGSVSLMMGFIFMGLCCIIMLLFNSEIAKLYIADAQVLPLASTLIFVASFFQLSDGIQAVALGILRGMADVNIPTIITLISYWAIGLPIGYYLAFNKNFGAIGIWIGLVVGLTASAILLSWRFYHNLKKMKI